MSQSEFFLRPSNASTWVRCYGMPGLSSGMPEWVDDDEDVEVREEGTACHWAAHQLATGNACPIGTVAPNSMAIDEDMLDACAVYFDAVRGWGLPQAYFELPVVCRRINPQCGGTTDVGAYDPSSRTIFVGDLKYGFRFVDVRDNWQLICYAVGLMDFFGIIGDVDLWVEFLIVQPRSYHRDGPVRRWRVRATELRGHINQLSNAAGMALSANPTCAVNSGCGRCAGRSRCETIQTAALGELNACYSATPHDLPHAAAEDELRRLQWARDIIDARVTGLEQQIIYAMRNGFASRHYAIEHSAGRLAWRDGSKPIITNIAQLYGAEITKPADLITPTQAAKKLPAAFIAQHSHRPPGGAKLVPVESSRIGRKLGK